ncbi:hypothetical protein ACTXT7_017427 [Hymenolepis weldensis]
MSSSANPQFSRPSIPVSFGVDNQVQAQPLDLSSVPTAVPPRSLNNIRHLLPPPPSHVEMPVDERPQHSANHPIIEHYYILLNTTDPPPSPSCPFNNFRYGTGIFPGVPPPIERDPEHANEQYLISHFAWCSSPPPAHTTPRHSPKLEFSCVRQPLPRTHSDYSRDL